MKIASSILNVICTHKIVKSVVIALALTPISIYILFLIYAGSIPILIEPPFAGGQRDVMVSVKFFLGLTIPIAGIGLASACMVPKWANKLLGLFIGTVFISMIFTGLFRQRFSDLETGEIEIRYMLFNWLVFSKTEPDPVVLFIKKNVLRQPTHPNWVGCAATYYLGLMETKKADHRGPNYDFIKIFVMDAMKLGIVRNENEAVFISRQYYEDFQCRELILKAIFFEWRERASVMPEAALYLKFIENLSGYKNDEDSNNEAIRDIQHRLFAKTDQSNGVRKMKLIDVTDFFAVVDFPFLAS